MQSLVSRTWYRGMRQRDIIELIAGSAIVWPLAVGAQKAGILHVGVAMGSTENDWGHQLLIDAFEQSLRALRLTMAATSRSPIVFAVGVDAR